MSTSTCVHKKHSFRGYDFERMSKKFFIFKIQRISLEKMDLRWTKAQHFLNGAGKASQQKSELYWSLITASPRKRLGLTTNETCRGCGMKNSESS